MTTKDLMTHAIKQKGQVSVHWFFLLCICREVGIECEEVPGHSKGIGYRQGQSLKNVKSDHLWNAVLLGGQWFLLDACWGAGRVDMEHESFVKRFVKRLTDDSTRSSFSGESKSKWGI